MLLIGFGFRAEAASPVTESVNPQNVASLVSVAKTVTAVYSDADGATNITDARLMVKSSSASAANSLCGVYNQTTNKLYMVADDGTTLIPSGGYTPGSTNTIANSQGNLNCAATTVSVSGNTLTIAWNFTPGTTFAGSQNLYQKVTDATPTTVGWNDEGDWVISNSSDAPVNVNVTPMNNGNVVSVAKTLTATYSDINGAGNIQSARLLVSLNSATAGNLCGLYDTATNKLFLYADNGTTLSTGYAPGSANTLSNSQGSLNCAATTVTMSGNILTIDWNFTPASSYTGKKHLYQYVTDMTPTSTGWDARGEWVIPSSNPAPVIDSVSPSSSNSLTGVAKNFTAVYSDLSGASNISQVRLMASSTTANSANSLCGNYNPVTNKLYLISDDGSTLIPSTGYAPGSANTITNSQGTLNCAATTVSTAGNTLTVNWNFTPSSSFIGAKGLYGLSSDSSTVGSYQAVGDWTISTANAAPINVSANPSTASSLVNVAKTITTVSSDANGASDFGNIYVMIDTAVGGANSLYAQYDCVNNKLYLRNDAHTASIGGFAPGSANVISNSQGSLNCAATTVVRSGSTITIGWNFTPSSTYTGTKNIYLYTGDTSGAYAWFQDMGDWNINPNPPTAPGSLTAVWVASGVQLNWSSSTGAVSYSIKRKLSTDTSYGASIGSVSQGTTTYTDTTALRGPIYNYIVTAVNVTAGTDSSEITTYTNLSAPGGLTATAGTNSISLSWSAVPGAASYMIQRAPAAAGPFAIVQVGLSSTTSSWTDTASVLHKAVPFYYQAFAISGTRSSVASNTASATPIAPAATPPVANNLTVGMRRNMPSNAILSASDVNGDAITYVVVTSPQHGTLSGTAPNLIYTPSTDYVGADSFTFKAHDVDGDSNIATVSLRVIEIDAFIRGSASEGWIGDGVVGVDQIWSSNIYPGDSKSFFVGLRSTGNTSSQTVKVSLPDYNAFITAGYGVEFYDATSNPNSNTNITSQITSANGWSIQPVSGEIHQIRADVMAPVGATVGSTQDLSFKASSQISGGAADYDLVKARFGVQASNQPDLAVRIISDDDPDPSWTGTAVFGTDGLNQILSATTLQGRVNQYNLRIKNTGSNTSTFRLVLPTAATGWTVQLFDALQNGADVTTAAQTTAGWTTPSIAPNATLDLLIKSTATSIATSNYEIKPLVTSGANTDVVDIKDTLQGVDHIEFSLDGQTWSAAPTSGVEVGQWGVLALRAVRRDTSCPWPTHPFSPNWTFGDTTYPGEEVRIHFPSPTAAGQGQTVQVTGGNTLSVVVRVIPEQPQPDED